MTFILELIGAMAAIAILVLAGIVAFCAIRGESEPPVIRLICVLAIIGAATPPYSAWGTGGMLLLAAVTAFICWADRDQRPPKGI